MKSLGFAHALIINSTDHRKFLYPDDDGNIFFQVNQEIFLSCPGSGNHFNINPNHSYKTFRCNGVDRFEAWNKSYNFGELDCIKPPSHKIAQVPQHSITYAIGFVVDGDGTFIRLATIQFENSSYPASLAISIIPQGIAGSQRLMHVGRIRQEHCCDEEITKMNMVYKVEHQRKSLCHQMSESKNSCLTNLESSGHFLTPVRLVPMSGHVYAIAGRSVDTYLNTAPMWTTICNGNWQAVKNFILETARVLRRELIVITGVGGQMKIKDQIQGLHLWSTGNLKKFSIPEYFWKIVLDPVSQRSKVFVVSNDPFLKSNNKTSFMTLCREPNFLRTQRSRDPMLGLTYTCDVNDFLSQAEIPQTVTRILTKKSHEGELDLLDYVKNVT